MIPGSLSEPDQSRFEDSLILRLYEPVLRFSQGERFFPMDVHDYIADSVLKRSRRHRKDEDFTTLWYAEAKKIDEEGGAAQEKPVSLIEQAKVILNEIRSLPYPGKKSPVDTVAANPMPAASASPVESPSPAASTSPAASPPPAAGSSPVESPPPRVSSSPWASPSPGALAKMLGAPPFGERDEYFLQFVHGKRDLIRGRVFDSDRQSQRFIIQFAMLILGLSLLLVYYKLFSLVSFPGTSYSQMIREVINPLLVSLIVVAWPVIQVSRKTYFAAVFVISASLFIGTQAGDIMSFVALIVWACFAAAYLVLRWLYWRSFPNWFNHWKFFLLPLVIIAIPLAWNLGLTGQPDSRTRLALQLFVLFVLLTSAWFAIGDIAGALYTRVNRKKLENDPSNQPWLEDISLYLLEEQQKPMWVLSVAAVCALTLYLLGYPGSPFFMKALLPGTDNPQAYEILFWVRAGILSISVMIWYGLNPIPSWRMIHKAATAAGTAGAEGGPAVPTVSAGSAGTAGVEGGSAVPTASAVSSGRGAPEGTAGAEGQHAVPTAEDVSANTEAAARETIGAAEFTWNGWMIVITGAALLIWKGSQYLPNISSTPDQFAIFLFLLFIALMLLGAQVITALIDGLSSQSDIEADYAAEKYHVDCGGIDKKKPRYYGRVCQANGWIILQYHFFYAYNDYRRIADGLNNHEGDWEMISIYLRHDSGMRFEYHDELRDLCSEHTAKAAEAAGPGKEDGKEGGSEQPGLTAEALEQIQRNVVQRLSGYRLYGVAYSQHFSGSFAFWDEDGCDIDKPDPYTVRCVRQPQGTPHHPVIYTALGSHANYPQPDEYRAPKFFSGAMQSVITSFDQVFGQLHERVRTAPVAHQNPIAGPGSLANPLPAQASSRNLKPDLLFEFATGNGLRIGFDNPADCETGDAQPAPHLPARVLARMRDYPSKEWDCQVILPEDDQQGWLAFRGLWGRHEIVPDESGPSGPKWNRPDAEGEEVRLRWGPGGPRDALLWKDQLLLEMINSPRCPIQVRLKAFYCLVNDSQLSSGAFPAEPNGVSPKPGPES